MGLLEEIALALYRDTWGGARTFWAYTTEGYVEGILVSLDELEKWAHQITQETKSPGDAISLKISMDESAKATADSLSDVDVSGEDEFITLGEMKIFSFGQKQEKSWGYVRTSSINIWGLGKE